MYMVNVAFHCQNFYVVALTNLDYEFLKPSFKSINLKHLSSIAWAKHKMKIDHRHSCSSSSIILFHVYIVQQNERNSKNFFQKCHSSHILRNGLSGNYSVNGRVFAAMQKSLRRAGGAAGCGGWFFAGSLAFGNHRGILFLQGRVYRYVEGSAPCVFVMEKENNIRATFVTVIIAHIIEVVFAI